MVSLHAEVPASGDILQLHDVIDNIERELHEKLHVQAVIHMDPIVTDVRRWTPCAVRWRSWCGR